MNDPFHWFEGSFDTQADAGIGTEGGHWQGLAHEGGCEDMQAGTSA